MYYDWWPALQSVLFKFGLQETTEREVIGLGGVWERPGDPTLTSVIWNSRVLRYNAFASSLYDL